MKSKVKLLKPVDQPVELKLTFDNRRQAEMFMDVMSCDVTITEKVFNRVLIKPTEMTKVKAMLNTVFDSLQKVLGV